MAGKELIVVLERTTDDIGTSLSTNHIGAAERLGSQRAAGNIRLIDQK
jgi:hypothetical protein